VTRQKVPMDSSAFFIQRPQTARRHLDLLVKALRQIAIVGWIGGGAYTLLALFVSRFLGLNSFHPDGKPGSMELSGMTFITWFIAIGLLLFSTLYYVAGRGLSQQKAWARYLAAITFLIKALICVWLGRHSILGMVIFLGIAALDFYGLWVLLSNETARLFTSGSQSAPSFSPIT
jgi:hypothetical protein